MTIKICEHRNQDGSSAWTLVDTPPDSSHPWFRCCLCDLYGFKRGSPRGANPKITPYRCGVKRCSGLAVHREPGRGPRGTYKWRCAKCRKPEASASASA